MTLIVAVMVAMLQAVLAFAIGVLISERHDSRALHAAITHAFLLAINTVTIVWVMTK
ncbi:hypothetical protein ACQKEF_09825 [Pseudomonas oryzihabitans]|jgi:hypothetical protein|uniref:hypothetical protein n=1 Tax=Pseudomonas oryzihabitans TaxID=47885 RepID=UPI002FAEB58C